MGLDDRIKSAQEDERKKKELAINLLEQKMSYLYGNNKVDQKKFDEDRFNLITEIKSKFNTKISKYINNIIIEQLENYNQNNTYKLIIPEKTSQQKQSKQLRNRDWIKASNQVYNIVKHWNKYIDSYEKEFEQNDRICHIVLSSLVYGGLNFFDGIVALINQIQTSKEPLCMSKDLIWIEFELNPKIYQANISDKNSEKCIRRWFPDHETLMWINNFLMYKNSFNEGVSELFTVTKLWRLLKKFLINLSNRYKFDISLIENEKKLCEASIAITERLDGVKLPEYIKSYSLGELNSVSLKPVIWEGLIKGRLKRSKPKSKKKQKSTPQVTSNIKQTIYKILNLANNRKITKVDAIDRLYSIDINHEVDEVLKNWIIYIIETRNNAISSALTYMSYVQDSWLKLKKESVDINNPQEMNNYFWSLAKPTNENITPLNYNQITTLSRLYHFAVLVHDFPEITFFMEHETEQVNVVDASIISHDIYKDFINDYKTKPSHSEITKKMIISIFIIFYRIGLRISELQKMRVRDVEIVPSEVDQTNKDIWIYIRSNQHGRNKTRSGNRRIPLGLFLTNKEKQIVINYFAIKTRKANVGESSPLFSWDFSSKEPIKAVTIYNIFREFLANKYNLNFVIHLFRHSAISRLFAIITKDSWLLSKLSDYSQEQENNIRKKYRLEGKDALWSLTKFAGHSSPITTLNTYVHFVDYHLYSALSKRKQVYDKNELVVRSGCSSKYITRNLKKLKTGSTIELININKLLRNSLSNYSKNITPLKNKAATDYNEQDDEIVKRSTEEVYFVLDMLERDHKPLEVAKYFKIDIEKILKWKKNAQHLCQLKNSRGNLRFVSKEKTIPKSGNFLAPTKPQSSNELKLIRKIFAKSNDLYEKHSEAFLSSINYYIDRWNYSTRFLAFSKPEDLLSFLKIISNFFPKKSIKLEFSPPKTYNHLIYELVWSDCEIYADKPEITAEVNQNRKYPNGRIKLRILHPDNNELVEKANNTRNNKKLGPQISVYHTHVLTFVYYLFAVRYLDFDELPTENNNN